MVRDAGLVVDEYYESIREGTHEVQHFSRTRKTERTVGIYLGVDPGSSGGLACIALDNAGDRACSMPPTERDVWDWVRWFSDREDVTAVIEKVGGYISGNATPGSAMFKFGMSYGGLRMALIAAGIPFEEVTPQAWQKALGITPRKKEESKTSFKNRLKAKAQQLFPKEKVTLATADALLIAEYARRKAERKR